MRVLNLILLITSSAVPVLSIKAQPLLSLSVSKEAKPGSNGAEGENPEYWDKKSWISNLQNIFKPPKEWDKHPVVTTLTTITTTRTSSQEPDITTQNSPTDETIETSETPVNAEWIITTPESEQEVKEKDIRKKPRVPLIGSLIPEGMVGNESPIYADNPQNVNSQIINLVGQLAKDSKRPGQYIPPDNNVISIQQWMNENRPQHQIQQPVQPSNVKIEPTTRSPMVTMIPNKEETVRPSPIKPSYDPPPWEKPNQNIRPSQIISQTKPTPEPTQWQPPIQLHQTPPPSGDVNPYQDYEQEYNWSNPPNRPHNRPPLEWGIKPGKPMDAIPEPKPSQPNKAGKPEDHKGWAKPPILPSIWGDRPYPEPGGDTNGLGGNVFGDGTGNGIGGMGNINGIGGGIIGSGSGNGEGGVGNQNGIGGNIIEDNAANGIGGSGDDNGLGGFVVGNGSGNGKGGVGNNNGVGGNRGGKHTANGTGGVGNHNGKGGIIIGTNSGNGIGGFSEGHPGLRPRPVNQFN